MGVEGKIILNGMLQGYYGKTSDGYMRFTIGIARSIYGQGNDPKSFLKCREFLIIRGNSNYIYIYMEGGEEGRG